jgi:hypothetical protein
LPVDQVPLVAKGPCHPPEAMHAVAFRALHLRTETPFLCTVVGSAVRVRVGNAEAVVDAPALGTGASIASLFRALFAADSPQAASAPASVHTASPRHRRAPALLDEEIISRLIGNFALACRVSKAITSLSFGGGAASAHRSLRSRGAMIHGISTLANLSPNAHALAFRVSQFGNGSTGTLGSTVLLHRCSGHRSEVQKIRRSSALGQGRFSSCNHASASDIPNRFEIRTG